MNSREELEQEIYNNSNGPQDEMAEGTIVGTDLVIQRMRDNILPLHVQKLDELNYTAEEKAELAAIYDAVPEEVKMMSNTVVEVHGCIIKENLPYKSRKHGGIMPGYFYSLFLCRDTETNHWFIAKSGSSGLTMHAWNMIRLREREGQQGWYLWEKPALYMVQIGKDNSHHFKNVGEPSLLKNRSTK